MPYSEYQHHVYYILEKGEKRAGQQDGQGTQQNAMMRNQQRQLSKAQSNFKMPKSPKFK
ncbi:hypothetical protein MA9V2_060 [Chryseobacterium phage MA9V-2]|nr:hypothetical protein MA9V2_060 [Chryseobacterium phage MA9V-2]